MTADVSPDVDPDTSAVDETDAAAPVEPAATGLFHGLDLEEWRQLVELADAVQRLGRPISVLRAIAQVMSDMPGIQKLTPQARQRLTGQAPEAGGSKITYAYRGIDQVTTEAQRLFGEHGVVLSWRTLGYEVRHITMGQNNSPWTEHEMRVEWTIHGPLGDSITIDTIGLGRDNSDKGSNKALTGAYKNLLLKLLAIGDPKDDPDSTRHEHTPGDRNDTAEYGEPAAPPPEPTETNTPGLLQSRALYDMLPRLADAQKAAAGEVRQHWGKTLTIRDFVLEPAYRAAVITAINSTATPGDPRMFVAPGDPTGADPTPPEPTPPAEPSPTEAAVVDEGHAAPSDGPMTEAQNRRLRALYRDLNVTGADNQLASTRFLLDLEALASHRDLTWAQAQQLVDGLQTLKVGRTATAVQAEPGGAITDVVTDIATPETVDEPAPEAAADEVAKPEEPQQGDPE